MRDSTTPLPGAVKPKASAFSAERAGAQLRISVIDQGPGRGTTFWIEFPALNAAG